ncbi:hypothetical protein KIN20_022499 [Parelaphostrongylus tenuis]|uniref:C2H2-type domain-containing protein n=1 Tax=Parelaphostrongylus tenuis TaxID=148309 RepID=A0AAD5QV84_PARTN|nr:hypothetical protein KIN20_022499 [Parelaphostrongylus tenuis]
MATKKSIHSRYQRLITQHGRCHMTTLRGFPCGSSGCHERLSTLERLCEHMFQVHGAPTDIKRKVFKNEAEFDEFLRELESRGGNFRLIRGKKTIQEGIAHYFRCNRTSSIAKDKAMRIADDTNVGSSERHHLAYEAVEDISEPVDSFGKKRSKRPRIRTEELCTAFLRKANLKMGLLGECYRFCMPGTALERRIMAVTPREAQNVAYSVQRGLDTVERRKHLEPTEEITEECAEGGQGVDFSTEGREEGNDLTELESAALEDMNVIAESY